MQIIVLRHAATAYNEKELINGRTDEELSSKGLAQIDGIVQSLAGYDFSVVYTSPLKRAVQTATPITDHYHVPLQVDPRIIEVDLGSFSGQGWGSTIPVFGMNSSELLSTCEYDFTEYGGESAEQTRVRVQSFIDDLKNNPNQKPVIVAHGGIIRWFYYLCTGQKTGRTANASVHTFTI